MSIDWGNIAAAAGVGAVSGFNQHKTEQKAQEQLNYDRGRNAVADEQAATLHGQTVKQNEFVLQSKAREQADAVRKEKLSGQLGQYQTYRQIGDIDGAAKHYVDFANQDNQGNPNFNPNHALSYAKNADGTVNINVVDRNTGAVVRAAKQNATIDDFIAATYGQMNPTGSYEAEVDNKAKMAQKQEEYKWKEREIGLKHLNDVELEGVKSQNTIGLEGYKFNNNLTLEEMRQQGANYREGLKQDGKAAAGTGTGTGTTVKGVASGVQGALQFAQQNAPMLQFIANKPDLYNKTMAMMAIESGGNPTIPSYNGSSYGLMQLHKRYAQDHANRYKIQGDPLSDPQVNLKTGAAHIENLDRKYGGNTDLIAFAYNAGEGVVDGALSRWKAAGQKGHWIDHVQAEPHVFKEAYNHAVKFNQALGLINGQGQPTGLTAEQQQQSNSQRAVDASNVYREGVSAKATQAINTVAGSMSKELGLGKDTSAATIGGLAGTQVEITKFANGRTKQERAAAYNNIYERVNSLIAKSEVGASMTPAEVKEYAQQKTAELVGATNKTEAGVWITRGMNPPKAKTNKPQQQSNLSTTEIDNVFNDDTPAEKAKAKPTAKTEAKTSTANSGIPLRSAGASFVPEGIQKTLANGIRQPPKTETKPKAEAKAKAPEKTANELYREKRQAERDKLLEANLKRKALEKQQEEQRERKEEQRKREEKAKREHENPINVGRAAFKNSTAQNSKTPMYEGLLKYTQ